MKWVLIGLAILVIAIIGIAFLVQTKNPVFYNILPKLTPSSTSQPENANSLNKINENQDQRIKQVNANALEPENANSAIEKQTFTDIEIKASIKTNDYRFSLSGLDLVINGNSTIMLGSGILKSNSQLTLTGFNGSIELKRNKFALNGTIQAIKSNELELELSNTSFKAELENATIKGNNASIEFLKANATGQLEMPKIILKLDNDSILFKKFSGSIELSTENQLILEGSLENLETLTDSANISVSTS